MRLLLFGVVILWLSADTRADNGEAKDALDKVNAGVEATNGIMEMLGDDEVTDKFGKIGQIAKKLGPFLGAIGPAIALISVFLPAAPSAEMKYMKKKFAEVDAKFDQVFHEFHAVKNLVMKTGLKAQYAAYEHTILSLSTKLQEYLSADSAYADVYNRSFIREYAYGYDGASYKVWNGMMEKSRVLSDNIAITAMDFFDNDRKEVQRVMKGVLNLLLQGVKVELAFLKARGLDQDYEIKKTRLGKEDQPAGEQNEKLR